MSAMEVTIPTLFALLSAYQRSGAFKAAIDLDLFTAIGEGNDSFAALAARCSAAERGHPRSPTRSRRSAFSPEGRPLRPAPAARMRFWTAARPAYVGSAATFVASPHS